MSSVTPIRDLEPTFQIGEREVTAAEVTGSSDDEVATLLDQAKAIAFLMSEARDESEHTYRHAAAAIGRLLDEAGDWHNAAVSLRQDD